MCKDIPILDGEKIVLKRMISGSLRLGQPEEFSISAVRADEDYGRDEGKYIIGFKIKGNNSPVSLILNEGDIKELTSVMWNAYLNEERSNAVQDLKDIFPVL